MTKIIEPLIVRLLQKVIRRSLVTPVVDRFAWRLVPPRFKRLFSKYFETGNLQTKFDKDIRISADLSDLSNRRSSGRKLKKRIVERSRWHIGFEEV